MAQSAVYVVQVCRNKAGVRVLARDPASAANEEFTSADALWCFLIADADAQSAQQLLASLRGEVTRHLEVLAARLNHALARDATPAFSREPKLAAWLEERATVVRLLKDIAQPAALGVFAHATLGADDEPGRRLQQRVRELLRAERSGVSSNQSNA